MKSNLIEENVPVETTMALEDFEKIFLAVSKFFDWYESNGELRARIPATSLESFYLSLYIFNNYAQRVSKALEVKQNRWQRVNSSYRDAIVRAYMRMTKMDVVNANIQLAGLHTKSLIDRAETFRAIDLVKRREEDDQSVIRDAEARLPEVQQAFQNAQTAYLDAYAAQQEAGKLNKLLTTTAAEGADDDSESLNELREYLNDKIRTYHSFQSVLRQRNASLQEIQFVSGLLDTIKSLPDAILALFLQSVEVLQAIAKAEEGETAFLETDIQSVAAHYRDQLSASMESLQEMNKHFKHALREV